MKDGKPEMRLQSEGPAWDKEVQGKGGETDRR